MLHYYSVEYNLLSDFLTRNTRNKRKRRKIFKIYIYSCFFVLYVFFVFKKLLPYVSLEIIPQREFLFGQNAGVKENFVRLGFSQTVSNREAGRDGVNLNLT